MCEKFLGKYYKDSIVPYSLLLTAEIRNYGLGDE